MKESGDKGEEYLEWDKNLPVLFEGLFGGQMRNETL